MSRYESAGLDGTGALQLRRISLLERGCIDAEEFSRRGRGSLAWHGRRVRVQRVTARIPVLRAQCEKST